MVVGPPKSGVTTIAAILENALKAFGIEVEMTGVDCDPVTLDKTRQAINTSKRLVKPGKVTLEQVPSRIQTGLRGVPRT